MIVLPLVLVFRKKVHVCPDLELCLPVYSIPEPDIVISDSVLNFECAMAWESLSVWEIKSSEEGPGTGILSSIYRTSKRSLERTL